MFEIVAIVYKHFYQKRKKDLSETAGFFTLQGFSKLKGVSKKPYQR